jgi:hypothetical protein
MWHIEPITNHRNGTERDTESERERERDKERERKEKGQESGVCSHTGADIVISRFIHSLLTIK